MERLSDIAPLAPRQSQLLIEDARNRYAALYELAPIAYCVLDRRGTILESNEEAATLLGRSRPELVGEAFTDMVAVLEPARFAQHLVRCFDEGTKVRSELTLATSRGAVGVELTSVPVRDSAGEI